MTRSPRSVAPKPLEGVRVVDLTVAWAGPMAARILAVLGAEVIHVEGPDKVDSWRDPVGGGYPERYPQLKRGRKPYNRSFKFNSQNLGKRGISVDLKQERGRRLLRELVQRSHVLITNFRPGTLTKLGCDPDELRRANPALTVVEMPAYGLDGPRSAEAGYGPTMEAACGMARMVGYGDGRPYNTGPAYLDPIGAYNGAAAVVTGLLAQLIRGEGVHLEVAQCEAAMHTIGEVVLESLDRGRSPVPCGNSVDYAEPHEVFPCLGEDEWLVVSIASDDDWARACDVLGLADLADDERFLDALGRRRNRAALYELLCCATRVLPKDALAHRLQRAGVASAPVCDGSDVARRPDLWQAGFYRRLAHCSAGTSWYQGLPLRYGSSLLAPDRPAPEFGQDNRYVAVELLGIAEDEFASLTTGAVMTAEPAGVPNRLRDTEAACADSQIRAEEGRSPR